jgi:hypothetical protein
MKGLLDPATLKATVGTTLFPLFFGLVGVAFGGDAPHSWVVDAGNGLEIPLRNLTLPAALIVFGRIVERAVRGLASWRPSFELRVVHREASEEPKEPPP